MSPVSLGYISLGYTSLGYISLSHIEPIREFDDILCHVNGWGLYQWILLIYTCGISMLVSYTQLASVLILYEPPDFRCSEAPPGNGFTVEEEAPTAVCNFDKDLSKKCCMPGMVREGLYDC